MDRPIDQPTTTPNRMIEVRLPGGQGSITVPAFDTDVDGLSVVRAPAPHGHLFVIAHLATRRTFGGMWSSLGKALRAVDAVDAELHLDWAQPVDPSLGTPLQSIIQRVREDLDDWPLGRPTPYQPAPPVPYHEPLHPGDNHAADAAVITEVAGALYVLLVRRGDGGGWALPGGKVDADEDAAHAAGRELLEEAGLDLQRWPAIPVVADFPVDDPRNTAEARMVTSLFLFFLPGRAGLPPVVGGDDAADARWFRIHRTESLDDLVAELAKLGGHLFRPHPPLLQLAFQEVLTAELARAYYDRKFGDAFDGVDEETKDVQRAGYIRAVLASTAGRAQLTAALAGQPEVTG